MELALPFGDKTFTFESPFDPANLAVARRQPIPEPVDWAALADQALRAPIGTGTIDGQRLADASVAILLDGTHRINMQMVLPRLMEQLEAAGVEDSRVTILLASGDAMQTADDMVHEVGIKLASKYNCVCHDALATDHRFMGFSTLGTPIFINKIVAEADYRIALCVVSPHATWGYSGGDDAVMPGAAGIETILRNRSLAFSYNSTYGYLASNPCRLDIENIGTTAGLDFVLNFVFNSIGSPVAAFAGDPVKAHRAAVNNGDRTVWGAELGTIADVTIASPGHDWNAESPFDSRALDFAAAGTKSNGTIIFLASPGDLKDQTEYDRLPVEQLARMCEKRDWSDTRREVVAELRAIFEAYLRRRPFFYRHVILVGSTLDSATLDMLGADQMNSLDEAVNEAVERQGLGARVALSPDSSTTLCLREFH